MSEGLDKELGLEEEKKEKVIFMDEEEHQKRKQFHMWEVNGKEYKMKLTTRMIEVLEKKYRTNILNLISTDGIPPLSVMLTIAQAAISPWHHNFTYEKTREIYEAWCEDGGNQMQMLSDVIMPVMVVSGFFTREQGDSIMSSLENKDQLL